MARWRQVRGCFRFDLLDVLRFWPVSLFSIGLTSFYYAMLGAFVPPQHRQQLTVAFVILAVLAISMFQFGTRGSVERTSPWNAFVRTLPAPLWARFVARLLLVLVVASFASMVVMSVGTARFGLAYERETILTVALAVPLAALVYSALGACLGGLLHPRVTPAAVTTIVLGTAWSSGLWSRGRPPEVLGGMEGALPLTAVLRLATAIAEADAEAMAPSAAVVAGWCLAGLMVAAVIHRRDEGERFR